MSAQDVEYKNGGLQALTSTGAHEGVFEMLWNILFSKWNHGYKFIIQQICDQVTTVLQYSNMSILLPFSSFLGFQIENEQMFHDHNSFFKHSYKDK
jgi:hypothetical protein